MLPYIILTAQFGLAAIFIAAALGKVLQSDQLAEALRASRVPSRALRLSVVLIPAVEVALALLLVISPSPWLPTIFGGSALLLAGFTAWMIWIRIQGIHLSCGCFGTGRSEIGRTTIVPGSKATAMEMADRFRLPFPCFAEGDGDAFKAYQVWATPFAFVIGTNGRVLSRMFAALRVD